MTNKHLSPPLKDTKTGYDNQAMDINELQKNRLNEKTKESLVYVIPKEIEYTQDKEYDPYLHRNVSHPTSFWETLIHMLKASLGTGILAMPNAFANAGYAIGTIGTLVIGLICTYTIHILISSEYELCKRKKVPSMTYPEAAEAAVSVGPKSLRRLSPYVLTVCNVFLLIYQLGSCCIYVVFIASNIAAVVKNHSGHEFDVRIIMAILLIPLILINWIRNLKYLAPLSTIGNCVTLVSFSIIFYYMFTGDIKPEVVKQRVAVNSIGRLPLYFGTVLFAMEALGVVLPLENEMKNPKKFGSAFGVLNCAMLPITILYIVVGFFGYWKYGDTGNGSITLDLPSDAIAADLAKLMLAFSIFVTHALLLYVAYDICWREYVSPRVKNHRLVANFSLRTVLVIITVLLAVAIPNLELFISLIGALCLSTMGLSLPALIQLFTYWYDLNGSHFALFFIKNLTIIIIALFGFVIGTETSLTEIYQKVIK